MMLLNKQMKNIQQKNLMNKIITKLNRLVIKLLLNLLKLIVITNLCML